MNIPQTESEGEDNNENIGPVSNYKGDTLLHIAAFQGDITRLVSLIEGGFWIFNQSPSDGASPLHRAAESGQIECAYILIDKGVPINIRDRNSHTPMHIAAENENYAMMNALINRGAQRKCHEKCFRCTWANRKLGKWKREQRELDRKVPQLTDQQSQEEKGKAANLKGEGENALLPVLVSSSSTSDEEDPRQKLKRALQQARKEFGDKIDQEIKRKEEEEKRQKKGKNKKIAKVDWNKNTLNFELQTSNSKKNQ